MEIKEIINDKIHLRKMKMNTNHPIPNNENTPFPNYGFSLLVSGRPMSGKTTMVMSQLTNRDGLFYKKFHKVFIFSPSLATIEKKIEIPEDQIFKEYDIEALQSIIDHQEANRDDPSEVLVVLDDMIADIERDNSKTFTRMILNRRHLNLSIICTTQSYARVKLKLRKAFSDFILFNTINNKEISFFFQELTPFSKDETKILTKHLLQDPHDFIMINAYTAQIFRNFNRVMIQVLSDDDGEMSD
jgi:hypothetical protein